MPAAFNVTKRSYILLLPVSTDKHVQLASSGAVASRESYKGPSLVQLYHGFESQ